MRSRRLSYVIGWLAVALLAVAGFAAFGNPDPTAEEVRVEAAAASMGHTAGAYAGVAFAYMPIGLAGEPATSGDEADVADVQEPSLEVHTALDSADEAADDSTSGTAAPTSGWLSEVEVRALVSLYFEPEDVNQAIRVAWCESRFDPDSIDRRSGGQGLFHHLPRYWSERAANAGFPGADPTDPEASVAAAAWAVYNGGGWDVFACRG